MSKAPVDKQGLLQIKTAPRTFRGRAVSLVGAPYLILKSLDDRYTLTLPPDMIEYPGPDTMVIVSLDVITVSIQSIM